MGRSKYRHLYHVCPIFVPLSRLEGLHDKLLRSNLTDTSFLIVNEREGPLDIPVYQQAQLQDDVWEALHGNKDDFLVYDRCGRLTCHTVLPYSFLHYPYIDAAVRATYHKRIYGNCTMSESTFLNGIGGGNMPNIHHQQHHQHHNPGSDTDKQDSN
uniref:Selenoprotein P N-terminal domain-containing protein n=1 Tax=Oncorhynchus kisutch TaxID=8019 RepID=A0A8C7I5E8_ONCKI